ncbi:221_t:CDS:1, partial [Funneliformis geosporum]
DFETISRGFYIHPNTLIPTIGCTGPGIPAFVVNIPVNEVFFDPATISPPARYIPAIPAGINPGVVFTINLYNIQQEVLML